jgi:hypothetical protein
MALALACAGMPSLARAPSAGPVAEGCAPVPFVATDFARALGDL